MALFQMRIIDAIRYAFLNIKQRRLSSLISFLTVGFLSMSIMIILFIGLNTYNDVTFNYTKAYRDNGYSFYISASSSGIGEYQINQIKNYRDNTYISYMCAPTNNIDFYDLELSFDSLKFLEKIKKQNDIILPMDDSSDYNVGDIYEATIAGYNYEKYNNQFEVVGFSEEIEKPVASIDYILDISLLSKLLIVGNPDEDLDKKDLYSLEKFYDNLLDIKNIDFESNFISNFKTDKSKAKVLVLIFCIGALLVLLSTLSVITNVIFLDIDSNKSLYVILRVDGASKNDLRKVAFSDIFLIVLLSTVFGFFLSIAFIFLYSNVSNDFTSYIIGNHLNAYLEEIKYSSNITWFIPFVVFLIMIAVILLSSAKRIKMIYDVEPSLLVKEVL